MKDETNSTLHCEHCRKNVSWHTNSVNHGGQFLLTLCTFGLWIPMWLAMTFSKTKFCDVCNQSITEE